MTTAPKLRNITDLMEEAQKAVNNLEHPISHYTIMETLAGNFEPAVPMAVGSQTFSSRPSMQDMDNLAAFAIRNLSILTRMQNELTKVRDALSVIGISFDDLLNSPNSETEDATGQTTEDRSS